MRLVVTWLSSKPVRVSMDGARDTQFRNCEFSGGTYAIRFAFHEIPRWHHLLGVPVALWLGLRRGQT